MGRGLGILLGGAIALTASSAQAVEQIAVQLGPLSTTLNIADLEYLALTGEVPSRLSPYRSLLTPTVQQALTNHVALDPEVSDRIVQDIVQSPNGQQTLKMLSKVTPELSPEVLQLSIQQAAKASEGMSVLGVIRAIPGKTLRVDGVALLSLLGRLGLAKLEQTALSSVLNHALIGETPAAQMAFDPTESGAADVHQISFALRDGDRQRTIPLDVYWSEQTRGPLVLLSHGFGADRYFLAYLAEHLASYGLTVVSIEHPGSNVEALVESSQGTVFSANEFLDRPQDVSFVLDRLAKLNQSTFRLRGRFNLDQITFIGHSLGGYTGLVLAGGQLDHQALSDFCQELEPTSLSPANWLQCTATGLHLPKSRLADDRITQLVVMNPITGKLFGPDGLRQVTVPTLVLTGTEDRVTPVTDQQLRSFYQLPGGHALIAVIGGTHLSVGDPDNINPALTQVPFMPELQGEETAQLRQYLRGAVLSFVMQQTPASRRYAPFLTADYAQGFSTPTLPLRYSDRLPRSVARWLWMSEILGRRLTPPLRSMASLLHLELIDLQHYLVAMQRNAIARFPLTSAVRSQPLPADMRLGQAPENPALSTSATHE